MKKKQQISTQEAKARLEQYCALQERSHHDVRYKLVALGIRGEDVEEIITHLVEQNYLDETRYAIAYARGKLRMNSWGWQKIKLDLKRKGISEYNLRQAFAEINTAEYDLILLRLLEKKNRTIRESNPFVRRQKLYRYAMGRGYEGDKINTALSRLEDQE